MKDKVGVRGEALKGHLDLLLLAGLEARPAHGYALVERLRSRSEGAFDLAEGTLYPALHRLEESGLVASQWNEESGRRRRVYQLTAKGRKSLTHRQTEWRAFARAVDGVVEGTA
jgi:PadR family transcriptional regulator PadR